MTEACSICGEFTDYPHTPIDHPAALGMRVHRMVRESKVAEAVAAHEATLRERGWMDEYEVETAAAMNFGDGQAAERARIVAGVEATPGVIGHASCIDLTAVLRIIEGETLSD